METWDVTEKVFSLGDAYEIRADGDEAPVYVVEGKVLAIAPRLTMKDAQGRTVATLTGDAINSRFTMATADAKDAGSVAFPLSIRKAFTLRIGRAEYKATGDLLGRTFACDDPVGATVLRVSRKGVLRAHLHVELLADLPRELALLAAIAIHQKYS